MLNMMAALGQYPAFWGFLGGLVWGLLTLLTAFSAAGTQAAQREAVLGLVIGVVTGPIVAEAGTEFVTILVPALAMKAAAFGLGILTVPYGPKLVALIQSRIHQRLGGQDDPR